MITEYKCGCGHQLEIVRGGTMLWTLTAVSSRLCTTCQDVVQIEYGFPQAIQYVLDARQAGTPVTGGDWTNQVGLTEEETKMTDEQLHELLVAAQHPSDDCPACGKETIEVEDDPPCPKCGSEMETISVILFD